MKYTIGELQWNALKSSRYTIGEIQWNALKSSLNEEKYRRE